MRRFLWILLAIFIAAVGMPSAHAGTLYSYTFSVSGTSDPAVDFTLTTDPMAAVTTQTSILAGDLASFSPIGSFWTGSTLNRVVLDSDGSPAETVLDVTESDESGDELGFDLVGFNLADFAIPGTYTSLDTTLVVTAVSTAPVSTTPEPSSLLLLGTGLLGALGVMRKRFV